MYAASVHNPGDRSGLVLTVRLTAVLCSPSCSQYLYSPVALEDRCPSSLSLALYISPRGCSLGLWPELVWLCALESVAYHLWALPFSVTKRASWLRWVLGLTPRLSSISALWGFAECPVSLLLIPSLPTLGEKDSGVRLKGNPDLRGRKVLLHGEHAGLCTLRETETSSFHQQRGQHGCPFHSSAQTDFFSLGFWST